MTLAFIDGFELQGPLWADSYSDFYSPVGTDVAFTMPGRDGGLANDIADMTAYRDLIAAAASSWVVGFSVQGLTGKPDGSAWVGLGIGTNLSFCLELFKTGSSVQGRLRTGDIGGNPIQISPGVTAFSIGSVGDWIELEIKVTLNAASSGSVEIRKNGINSPSLVNLSGIKTTEAGTSSGARSGAFHTGPCFAFDDMWWIHNDGIGLTDWVGAGKKIIGRPLIGQVSVAYSPVGAATNLAAVTDTSDASEVQSNTNNDEDSYSIAPVSAVASTVLAVQTHARVRAVQLGQRQIRLFQRFSGNTAETSPFTIASRNRRTIVQTRSVQPNGSAWTIPAVDGLNIGMKTAN